MTKIILLSASAVVAALLAAAPARAAGLNRVWVSGHGTDAAGCGAPVDPCRSLQYAHDNVVAAGGEIDILDPAGYGSISITKSISIVNQGGVAGVQQATAGQAAISINVGAAGSVTLRGLTIDGLGVAQDGIDVKEAGALTVDSCVVRHFTHDGLNLRQTSGTLLIAVVDTTASDNTANGFDVSPSSQSVVHGFIDHANAIYNGANGVNIVASNQSGDVRTAVTVSDSNLSDNTSSGAYIKSTAPLGSAAVAIRNDKADDNAWGYYVDTGGVASFSSSEALSDSVNVSAQGLGATFGDNAFANVVGTLAPSPPS
jgi:hypothetical protein